MNHYWFALEALLVRTPLLYALMLYASRGSDFTIYKKQKLPLCESFA